MDKVEILGEGGTDPCCIFEYFEANKIKPKLVVIFTDGYIGFDEDEDTDYGINLYKKYKGTIWIIPSNGNNKFKAPFGKTAIFDVKSR